MPLTPDGSVVDVAVAGGGPAGLATAIELAQRGVRTLVLERGNGRAARIGETLNPDIAPHLMRLGVWEEFLADGHAESFAVRSAWGQSELSDTLHIMNPYGPGWHVDRQRFDHMLRRRAHELGADVRCGTRVLRVEREAGYWRLELAPESTATRQVRARFLVDASGRASPLRRGLGAPQVRIDQLIGVAVWFAPAARRRSDDGFALVEAVEHGWWYSAPVPNLQRVAMLMCDLDTYRAQRRRSRDFWRESLKTAHHTRTRLAGLEALGPAHVHLAHSHIVAGLGTCARGWLPVGEALMGLDPLSGLGISNAFNYAELAGTAITSDLRGDAQAVSNYMVTANSSYMDYLRTRRHYYIMEDRWPDRAFWRTRQAPLLAAGDEVAGKQVNRARRRFPG